MKKAFTMCLCFVLLLTLVSCSNDTNSTDSEIECSNCGAAIAEEAKFCSSCGTLVDNKPDTFLCPHCDEANSKDAKFCSSCGMDFNSSNDDSNNDESHIKNDALDYILIREEMNIYCNGGMYNIANNILYSVNISNGTPLLSKMNLDGSNYSAILGGTPSYITIDGEYYYFIIESDNDSKIYRCSLGGNDLLQLVYSDATYLQVTKDYLYYNKYDVSSGKTLGFYRSNKDGSYEQPVMQKEIYYSYVVGDYLYYQDDIDNERIHRFNLKTKIDEVVTSGISYGFIIDGEYAYYVKNDNSVADDDFSGTLVKIDLITKTETTIRNGVFTGGMNVTDSYIYFVNTNDSGSIYRIKKDGTNEKKISNDTDVRFLTIVGNKLLYSDYNDSKGYIDAIYMCNHDGSNKVKINKN